MARSIILGPTSSPLMTFNVDDVLKISGESRLDVSGGELFADWLEPGVNYVFILPNIYKPTDTAGYLTSDGKIYADKFVGFNLALRIPYGTKLTYQVDGVTKGVFYTQRIKRSSRDNWEISATSIIGLYDHQEHKGNIYTGQTFLDVLVEIIEPSVCGTTSTGYSLQTDYELWHVDTTVADQKVYGYLPYDTKRNNLHQLLFSCGASLVRNSNYEPHIKFLRNLDTKQIERDRIFLEGSVSYDPSVTGVEVVEHTFQFAYNTPPTNLFDNTNAYAEPAQNTLVKFSSPVKEETLQTIGGLTIVQRGPNFAVVNGKGVLSGIPYTHLTRTLRKTRLDLSIPENLKPVTQATLISPFNSENVLERLFNLYTRSKVIEGSIELEDENLGDLCQAYNVFGEPENGILTRLSYNVSSFTKAAINLSDQVSPGPFGNNYNEVKLFTRSGLWTVPTALRQSPFPYVRLTLVGAGNGGEGGQGGMQGRGMWPIDGLAVTGSGSGPGGKGGRGGVAGSGGRVLTVARLDLSNISHIEYVCGSGGAAGSGGPGGDRDTAKEYTAPGLGGAGSDTILRLYNDSGALVATYTTANGSVLPSGVANLATSEVYGLAGKDGQRAGDGGEGGVASASADGGNGEDITVDGVTWHGGTGSKAAYAQQSTTLGTMVAECGGAGGSGAAYGRNGNPAKSDGHAAWRIWCEGGYGGDGVSSSFIPAAATTYGQGGDGGHGGSGGGTGGAQNNAPVQHRMQDGEPGKGGDGTPGAVGAPGCIFMYIGGTA